MLNFFVRRPVTTIMFVLFWVVLGLYSFPNMNIERTPAMDFPMVTATFVYPGAAPAEIESQIVKKAEDAMAEVSGLKKITSQAFENGAFVMAEFNLGVRVDDKAAEVKAKIDALSSEFPDDMRQPVVERLNPLQESVVDIVLRGADSRELQEYVDNTLSTKITAIPGVASVSVFGGRERAVRVAINPDQLAARGATIMDIVSALGNKNLNVPGGKIERGTNASNVRFIGEFQSVADIENLRVITPEGQNFKISDVATVTDAARDIETGARYNGEDVVIASVVKASDGNAIKVSRALRNRLDNLQSEMQNVLPKATMEIVSDSSTSVLDDTVGTIWSIVLGILFTVLTLIIFTGNWRSTIIAGVVIPASLIAGFFFMDFSGFTINMITLLAYSSALGTLVSNAIILIESALGQLRNGADSETAAIVGTKKVAVSVLAGVGTNVVVFLPLAFMGGIAGKFMVQFGMTVVYLTLLSLLFSFTLTPMMIAQVLKVRGNKSVKSEQKPKVREMGERMRKWYDYQYAHSGRVVLIAVVMLIGSAMLTKFIGSEFSPSVDADEITITARAPMGATFEKSSDIAKQIEHVLSEFPDVKATTVKIGERGLQNITVKITLAELGKERSISDKKLAQQMLPKLAEIADVEIQIRAGQGASSSLTSDMTLNVFGDDDALREKYSAELLERINAIEEVQSAVLAQQVPNYETRLVPDQAKMNYWGVSNSYAGAALRTALYGNDTYKYKENGEEYPILLEFARPFKNGALFDNVLLNSPKGMVALSDIGTVEFAPATSDIRRLNKSRITQIDINIGKSTIGPVQKKIEAEIAEMEWVPGYYVEFGGMSEMQSETEGEMGMAFLLATILTFMLLAAILNSLTHPLTIATSIITSFTGVFVLLFLTGTSINIGAMLSFVMLVGLVVNNNILVLEPTVARIAKGEKADKALWAELNDKRGMVLMTSIAIIAGMLPQLWSGETMKVAMGAVLIGGMLTSLIYTFVLTPALFFMLDRLRHKIKGK